MPNKQDIQEAYDLGRRDSRIGGRNNINHFLTEIERKAYKLGYVDEIEGQPSKRNIKE